MWPEPYLGIFHRWGIFFGEKFFSKNIFKWHLFLFLANLLHLELQNQKKILAIANLACLYKQKTALLEGGIPGRGFYFRHTITVVQMHVYIYK